MKRDEILITPNLHVYTPLDSDKYPAIIKVGEESIAKRYDSTLAFLSLDDKAYEQYREDIGKVDLHTSPVIDKIVIDNPTFLNDETIRHHLTVKTGEALDFNRLDRDIKAIHGLMYFDDVKYDISTNDGITTLTIITAPSWDINGQVRFAFGFEDNFDGHSDYTVKFEYLMSGLNSYGGEWRSRFTIGVEKLLYSELYQPIDLSQRWYLRPNLFYRDKKTYISPTILGDHSINADPDQSYPIQVKEYGVAAGIGIDLTDYLQVEAGAVAKIVRPEIDLFIVGLAGEIDYRSVNVSQNAIELYLKASMDTFDNTYFPTKGYLGEMIYTRQMPEWGSETEFSQFYGELSAAYTIGDHTLIPLIKTGQTFRVDDFEQSQDFSAYYTLGGLFDLSGLPTNAISGDHMVFGSLQYRYRLSKKDLFGALSVPLYAGLSLEAGDTWYEEHDQHLERRDIIYASSVYLAADTLLGPLYLGVGAADNRYYSIYLSLGRSF